jgi:hypothetical protein
MASTMMDTDLNDQTHPAVRTLAGLPGLELKDSWRGCLSIAGSGAPDVVADVRMLSADHLRVSLPLGRDGTPPEHLAHHDLPGNVRFALTDAGPMLLADTRVDGREHLHASLGAIRGAFAGILDPKTIDASEVEPVPPAEEVRSALAALDDVVDHADGWELRPRVQGRVYAIAVAAVPGGLHLVYRVLDAGPDGAALTAIRHVALRLNARLRLSRLSWVPEGLVAEARLHAGQFTADWLDSVARAVAVAGHLARSPARILADRDDVAAAYTELVIRNQSKESNP